MNCDDAGAWSSLLGIGIGLVVLAVAFMVLRWKERRGTAAERERHMLRVPGPAFVDPRNEVDDLLDEIRAEERQKIYTPEAYYYTFMRCCADEQKRQRLAKADTEYLSWGGNGN